MPSLDERLRAAAEALDGVSDTARLDVEYLMAHALGVSRGQLLQKLGDTADTGSFQSLLERRLAYEPIPYILGEWEFYSIPLAVRAPMLVPRPETEHLVEVVLKHVNGKPADILEIGAGTGCVSLAIALNAPETTLIATDVNPAALKLTAENLARHGVDRRVRLLQGDLFEPFRASGVQFDVICSNPPYVEEPEWEGLDPSIRLYEDRQALVSGPDGLDIIRRLVDEAWRYLRPGALLAFELGMGQYESVWELLAARGYVGMSAECDLAGIPRIAAAFKPLNIG